MARIRRMDEGEYKEGARIALRGCHLYVVQEETDGPIKIGISRNAFWRRSDLQIGNHRRLNFMAVFVCQGRHDAILIEASVLTHFSSYRLSGEWIDCKPSVVIDFIMRETGCGTN